MEKKHNNLLFITADEFRAECLTNAFIQTPNLDSLAKSSTVFLNHFGQASPCGPSRACLHTGTYLNTNRVINNETPLSQDLTNWAKVLRENGYNPTLIGYTDSLNDPRSLDFTKVRDMNVSERTEFGYNILPGLRFLKNDELEKKYPNQWNGVYGSREWAEIKTDNQDGFPPANALPFEEIDTYKLTVTLVFSSSGNL